MDRLISLQAAIDAVEEVEWYHQNRNNEMVSGANSEVDQPWYKADDIYAALNNVPTAEPKWIPCSERLPEEDGRYLVCGAKGGIYHANRRGVWWTQVGCGGKLVPTVVAWMPLPEPYKGE